MAKKQMKQGASKAGKIFERKDIAWKKTDGKTPYLETNIDRLYHLLKKRQSISFFDAAREFEVDKEQIASWARILEEHRLANVHYPIFGGPVIFSVEIEQPVKGGKVLRKAPGKKAPKIIIALTGGLLVFLGYVMVVSNPFTISMRSQLTSPIGTLTGMFRFLPYPLNIIIPVAIIIAVLWAVMGLKRRRKLYKKEGSKDIESKLDKIKKELGS